MALALFPLINGWKVLSMSWKSASSREGAISMLRILIVTGGTMCITGNWMIWKKKLHLSVLLSVITALSYGLPWVMLWSLQVTAHKCSALDLQTGPVSLIPIYWAIWWQLSIWIQWVDSFPLPWASALNSTNFAWSFFLLPFLSLLFFIPFCPLPNV